jgi:hypothetical protein
MKISSLEVAESVVENNGSLYWNGWDIVHYTESKTGWTKPSGAYRNGKWVIMNTYPITEEGWDIPAKLVRDDAK